ncbi:MAG: hypothetical protein SFV18_20940 [Bryobacteraceae bacterium]|nr:hypothetical protein [Bryobacteraceae bacterium]
MNGVWKPENYIALIVATTAALCVLILVGGTVAGVLLGKLDPEKLGSTNGWAVGGGLLGFMGFLTVIVWKVVK